MIILERTYTFKYHVSCTDGEISVRIDLLFHLFFHRRPCQQLCVFFPVGLSSLIRPVENVVLTTKGLQERNTTVGWNIGGKIGEIINQFCLREKSTM